MENQKKKVNSSPERYSFQKERYIKRCLEENKQPDQSYLDVLEGDKIRDLNYINQDVHENDMQYDLRSTQWICDKVKNSDVYAQNLYAAMCNQRFIKNDVWPILQEETWSCSWRSSGGIVANMQEKGDYIDWYCSGINDGGSGGIYASGIVAESIVTKEIEQDLLKLGWNVIESGKQDS